LKISNLSSIVAQAFQTQEKVYVHSGSSSLSTVSLLEHSKV